jgi:hypothetical protein
VIGFSSSSTADGAGAAACVVARTERSMPRTLGLTLYGVKFDLQ